MSRTETESTVGVYILVGLLIIVLVSATTVIAADRTVLDSEHAVGTIEDENVAAETTVILRNTVRDELQAAVDERTADGRQSEPLLDDEQVAGIAESAVSERYVEDEWRGQIERTYAYIDGDRERLRLVFDLREPRRNAIDGTEAAEREALVERSGDLTDPEEVADEQLVITPSLAAALAEERNITRDGAPPSEVETAAGLSGWVGILAVLLPVVALALLGGLYVVTGRSVRRAGTAAGAAAVGAGLMGLVLTLGGGTVARGAAKGRLGFESPEFEPLADGVVAIVGHFFDTTMRYSVALTVAGMAVLGVVAADEHGYFDRFRGDESDRSAESRDDRERDGESADSQQRAADSSARDSPDVDTTDSPAEYDPDQYDEHGFRIDDDGEERSGGRTDDQ